jgi:hypothetical protein
MQQLLPPTHVVPIFVLEHIISVRHVDRPAELLPLRLVVDLLQRHVVLLAPGHRDPRIQIVELGGAQRDRLVLVPVRLLYLQLLQLLEQALQRLLLLLHVLLLCLGAAALVGLLGRLQLLLRIFDGLLLGLDFPVKILHGLLVGLGDRTLMVAENGNRAVGSVIAEHLGLDRIVRVGELIQLLLQRKAGVIRTEHLHHKYKVGLLSENRRPSAINLAPSLLHTVLRI